MSCERVHSEILESVNKIRLNIRTIKTRRTFPLIRKPTELTERQVTDKSTKPSYNLLQQSAPPEETPKVKPIKPGKKAGKPVSQQPTDSASGPR